MKLPQPTPARRILTRALAVAAVGAGALALAAAPSQALTSPKLNPGGPVLLVRDFVDGNTIIGQIYISPCPGAPLPPGWGVTTGPSKLVGLPCSADFAASSAKMFPAGAAAALQGTRS